jgi:hypothetical protein
MEVRGMRKKVTADRNRVLRPFAALATAAFLAGPGSYMVNNCSAQPSIAFTECTS